MPKVKNNPLLKGLSGMLGKVMVFKQWQGQTVVSHPPGERKSSSEKQLIVMDRFTRANSYASRVMNMPEEKAEYAKGIAPNKNNAHRVAVTDFLNAPVVHYIKVEHYKGAIGESITIKATDDFRVIAVKVKIYNRKDLLLEEGNALPVPRKKFIWKYTTTTAIPNFAGTVIKVSAYDKPGNEGTGELRL